jgi:hypothetical protein
MNLAVAVDELDELDLWIGSEQLRKTAVSRSRCRKWHRTIQFYDLGAEFSCYHSTLIRGTRVDVNHGAICTDDGPQTRPQALALVSANDDDSRS